MKLPPLHNACADSQLYPYIVLDIYDDRSGPKLGLATFLTPVVIGRKYMPLQPVAGTGDHV